MIMRASESALERGHINQFRQVLGGLEKSLLEIARAQIKVGDHLRVLKRSRPAMRFCKGSKVSKDVEMSTDIVQKSR